MKPESLEDIKQAVQCIIKERNGLALNNPEVMPSKYWQYFSARTKYLLDLSEESLRDIRYHTYHLTSDLYQRYVFGDPEVLRTDVLDLQKWSGLSEPDNGIGFDYLRDGFTFKISTDLMGIDSTLKMMYENQALNFRKIPHKIEVEIVEIGAGYGGLAYHLIKWLSKRSREYHLAIDSFKLDVRYYIVDLPEILLFSAIYLKMNMPEAKMYIYTPGEPVPGDFNDYDIVLIPNYRADILKTLSGVKLVINIASFQEMTVNQVREYLELTKGILADIGCLFSWNMDRNPANVEPDLNVSELLKGHFNTTPATPAVPPKKFSLQEHTARILRAAALFLKLLPPAPEPFYPEQEYKGYVCRRKGE